MIFASMPSYHGDEREILLLSQSLRQFGGRYAQSPIVVLEPLQSLLSSPARDALTSLGASILPFSLPEAVLSFPFAQKIYAAAEAESVAGSELLVWMDSDTVILDQPTEFSLTKVKDIGCCPVQLKNISSLASDPPSTFWKDIFHDCGTPAERIFPVTTTMDHLEIHAHFNAGLLVVRPQRGLLTAWKENFERITLTANYQPYYKENSLYRIFIHQAVLAATLLSHLTREDFQLFSERYNAAIFLHPRFPLAEQEPVTCRYDDFSYFQNPSWESTISEVNARLNQLVKAARLDTDARLGRADHG